MSPFIAAKIGSQEKLNLNYQSREHSFKSCHHHQCLTTLVAIRYTSLIIHRVFLGPREHKLEKMGEGANLSMHITTSYSFARLVWCVMVIANLVRSWGGGGCPCLLEIGSGLEYTARHFRLECSGLVRINDTTHFQ